MIVRSYDWVQSDEFYLVLVWKASFSLHEVNFNSFNATPRRERAPLMQWIADLRRENDSRHLIHARVELYESSSLAAKREPSLL